VQAGAEVDVAMTPAATQFITPLTFRSLTAREPYVDLFSAYGEGEAHVELARRADLMVIAPAAASTMARLAQGMAEDFVSLTALATQAPLLIAPAMDSQMWEHEATRGNRYTLEGRGVTLVGPVPGRLASGRIGGGRMAEPATIVDAVKQRLGRARGDLGAVRIVVTAGGTREALDPVRYLGNHSSGKMGYAIAEAARDRGADVALITTAALPDPYGVRVIRVESAMEMGAALETECESARVVVMAGAVADYSPANPSEQKIKRADSSELSIDLVENPDLIASVSGNFVKVAFAAETENLLANAAAKLEQKGAQLIVANDVTAPDAGFGTDTNRVTILDRDGGTEELPLLSKYEVAERLLDRLGPLLAELED
jgi:phosphopantothenoylcysteine decarboxylase/phosphopantothenate--cysteine ligase